MAVKNGQIKRYNTTTSSWDEFNPKTLASLVTYDGTSDSVKTILDTKANDNAVVHLAGDETITGVKTFNSGINISGITPTSSPGVNIGDKNHIFTYVYAAGFGSTNSDSVHITIPQVTTNATMALTSDIKDATITIQKNGTNVDTFTVNQASNKTINISDVASASTLSSHTSNTSNPHSVTKSQVGLGNVTNDAQVKRTEMAAANGVATLDENTKIPLAQIPDSILGNMTLGGTVTYASSTLTADLSANGKLILARKTGKTVGDTVIIKNQASDEGTTTLTALGWVSAEGLYFIAQNSFDVTVESVVYHFEVGDWLISIGTGWRKIDNTDAVVSVNGKTGAVTLYGTDIAVSSTDTTKIDVALAGKQTKVSTLGSNIRPVYISGSGTFSQVDKDYAGGTNVTLNGTPKTGTTASFYAPTNAGTENHQILMWDASDDEIVWTSSAIGSLTSPVYINSMGALVAGSTYAGGTAVTLNNDSKSGTIASFYAPTTSGTSGQILQSKGAGQAPEWVNASTFTDTWRDVYVNGTQVQGTGTNSGALKLINGTNTTVVWDSTNKTIQVNATNTTYSAGEGLALEANKFYLAIPMGTTAPTTDLHEGSLWFDITA